MARKAVNYGDELRDAQLVVTAPCAEWKGSGVVYDPEGFGWLPLLFSLPPAPSTEQVAAAVRERMDALGLDREPPEKAPCTGCEGDGRTIITVGLPELVRLIAPKAGAVIGNDPRSPIGSSTTPVQAPRNARTGHGR